MKNLKSILGITVLSLFLFASCQSEEDVTIGDDPNQSTNSADSETADLMARNTAHDGSEDDFLDGLSCSSIVLPVVAEVNGQELTIISQSDFALIADIFAQFTNDDDEVNFQFPITVTMSDYTEVVINNQAEYDALKDTCAEIDSKEEDAINCLDIDYPITVFTYDANAEQTGSVVLDGEQETYVFLNNLGDSDFFSVSYPISLMAEGNSAITINSDAEFKNALESCEADDDMQAQAEAEAKAAADELEAILTDATFKVETGINNGVEFTEDFVDFTLEFANDGEVIVRNTLTNTAASIEGSFQVVSETNVNLELTFAGNSTFNIISDQFEVVSQNESTIELQSSTNSAVTLVLTKTE